MITLDGISITETVARGKFSAIYRGVQNAGGLPIVVKVLDREFPTPVEQAKFKHEYKILKDLDINGVIRAYSLEKYKNSPAMVLEDFGGIPLKAILEEKNISLINKLKIVKSAVGILGQIHAKNIIHKDLTPNNILLNPKTGIVKIIDFGIASILSQESLELTSPDHLEGTLAYMSPEQTGRMNRPIDYRTDFYTLGITLYEMLLGKRPFEARDNMELVHMHMAVSPAPLHTVSSEIPEAVSSIVQKMIEKNAEERYRSAFAIKEDLEKVISHLTSETSLAGFVAGQHDVSDRFSIPGKLYGRERETGELLETFERVSKGNTELLLVSGYSGIGKSALIHEIHKPITEHRGYFIYGKFDQYKRNIPYSSLIQAFEDLIRQILTESDESIAGWKERLLLALETSGQIFIDVIPDLEHIIGPQKPVAELGPQEARNRFLFYFRNFVQVFTKEPLTLFLDDLQWADIASLSLLELLATDANSKHLFIIGAFRDNEVDGAHPLMLMLERIRKLHIIPRQIHLENLKIQDVTEIVKDTFSCDLEKAKELSGLILKKTGGNPFFINQLLKTLYESKLTRYDYEKRSWTWDLESIHNMEITDNVIDLMTGKITGLPGAVQQHLKYAACMGGRFSLYDLSIVSESELDELSRSLQVALHEEMLVPLGEDYKLIDTNEAEDELVSSLNDEMSRQVFYRFLHDRVQQAAYSLLDKEEKEEIHSRIGQLMLMKIPVEQREEKIFDILNHFNLSTGLIQAKEKKLEIAELNLKAALRARDSIAYQPALNYIKHAQNLLDDELQKEHPSLVFQLLLERAECEHLTGADTEAETFYTTALEKASDDDERGRVYERLIHFYTNTGNFKAAYQTARRALRLYGVNLPGGFIPPLFLADAAKAWWSMRNRKIKDLIDLPPCTDEKKSKAMRLIAAVLKAAYQIRPELSIASAVKAVNLSLKYGSVDDIAIAYMVFGGIFLGSVVGKHKVGYEFGKLALAMNEKYDNLKQRSEVNFVSAYFTNFWFNHARRTESFYKNAYEAGLQSGDFFHVACSSCTLIESNYIRGVPLEEIENQGKVYYEFMGRINSKEAAGAIQAVIRSIQSLRGETESHTSFGDESFQEAEYVEEIKLYTSLHFSHFYFINKMQTLYLWGEIPAALELASESERYLKYSVGMLHTVEHYFYHALILLASYRSTRNRKYRTKAKKIVSKINKWAGENEDNFKHKALLLEAEIQRSDSKGNLKILAMYEEAAESAKASGYIQNAAMINEQAGRYLLESHNEMTARNYLKEAIYWYSNWGATGIADSLSTEFASLVGSRSELAHDLDQNRTDAFGKSTFLAGSTNTRTGTGTGTILDLDTVMKSSQAISGEIKLGSLLEKMISIMIENAGAQKGFFITSESGQLVIEAFANVETGDLRVEERLPVEKSDDLARSVVQFVARTEKSVLLENAVDSDQFRNDPYVKKSGAKSILCTPVVHKGKTIAFIYLENNLSTNVFTPARLEMLNLLATQSAISLENARHYDELEQKVAERTHDLREEQEKSESLLLNILPLEIANELKQRGQVTPLQYRSVSIMFTDFKGFTRVASKLPPEKLLEELDRHFSKFDEISSRYNLEKLKTIGDSYMCAGGLPKENTTHPLDICLAAMEFQNYIAEANRKKASAGEDLWEVRLGIHSGSVIAGVIGQKKFTYDVWGDAVNVASRMESNSIPGKINVSEKTYKLVKDFFVCDSRGALDVKNKGAMEMYFLNRIRPEFSTDESGYIPKPELYDAFAKSIEGSI